MRRAESHVMANQQVRFGSESRSGRKAAPVEASKCKSGSSRSSREGKHTTSMPTGSDRELRLKQEFEGMSTIKEAQPHMMAPKREVSLGQGSTRRMCQSPTESSDDEDESYLAIVRRRRAEDRTASPKSRRFGERPSRDRWQRPERDQ
jgi:hypothetical protein